MDERKTGGGCLGTLLLFPAFIALLMGVFGRDTSLIYTGIALVSLFFCFLYWFRPARDLIKPALQAAALWIFLSALGFGVNLLLPSSGIDDHDYLCDTGPMATRC